MSACRIFVALCLVAMVVDPNGVSGSEKAHHKQMHDCCKRVINGSENVNCDTVLSGDAKQVLSSGASLKQLVDVLFACVSGANAKKDNTECCHKANITEPCLAVCNPAVYESHMARYAAFIKAGCPARVLTAVIGGQHCVPSGTKVQPMSFGSAVGKILAQTGLQAAVEALIHHFQKD